MGLVLLRQLQRSDETVLLDYLFDPVGSQYLPDLDLISVVHSQNTASIGLASSLGASFEKALSLKEGEVWHVYRHPRVA